MAKIVRENLNEAKLNLPQEYIDKVRKEAGEKGWIGGPSMRDIQEMNRLMSQIIPAQQGHEEELTQLGIDIIKKFYGPVLDGVELDVKIVDPNDPEKLEMTQKMIDQSEQQEEQEQEEEEEIEMELPGLEADIDKRKLINNVMQGEAQNVHDMMYDAREQVTEITGDPQLLDNYMRFLELNKKFDWDENVDLQQMMKQMPQMANAMETEWEEEKEEGEGDIPKIKARVLDLPMLIHETVKGIYELISAGAIDPDPVRAKRILTATDTLKDEQEDIRFGPFIAKDIRDYVNSVADDIPGASDIPNLREFVFGKMIVMKSNDFVDLVTDMLMKKESAEATISKFINDIKKDFEEYNQQKMEYEFGEEREEEIEQELPDDIETEEFYDEKELGAPQPPEKPDYKKMGQSELKYQLDKAIDNEDWALATEIQQYIKDVE